MCGCGWGGGVGCVTNYIKITTVRNWKPPPPRFTYEQLNLLLPVIRSYYTCVFGGGGGVPNYINISAARNWKPPTPPPPPPPAFIELLLMCVSWVWGGGMTKLKQESDLKMFCFYSHYICIEEHHVLHCIFMTNHALITKKYMLTVFEK